MPLAMAWVPSNGRGVLAHNHATGVVPGTLSTRELLEDLDGRCGEPRGLLVGARAVGNLGPKAALVKIRDIDTKVIHEATEPSNKLPSAASARILHDDVAPVLKLDFGEFDSKFNEYTVELSLRK